MKKLLSIILSIIMLLAMSLATLANNIVICPEDTELPQEVKILKVGINAEYPPFEYYKDDKLTGFDIDLMNYIGERIGFEIEYVDMSFDKLIPAVVNGEVDCAISAIMVTEERECVIDYTTPYLVSQVADDAELYYEQYAIVFPDNYVQKAKLADTAGQEFIYTLVNDAIKELIDDATVEKLIQKYELNKRIKETGYSYFVAEEITAGMDDMEISATPLIRSVLFNYNNADKAVKVGELLNFKANDVYEFHLGKVNEEQTTVSVIIDKPEDIKKFYDEFTALEFTDNTDVEDAISILMRVELDDDKYIGSYYTHYGIFGEGYGGHTEKISGKYISENELYKIVDNMGYEWKVNIAGVGPIADAGVVISSGTPLAPPSEWAKTDIDKAKALNIINDDVFYRYRMSITREEFCELAYNYITEFGSELTVSNNHKFSDTDNEKVEALNSLGIIYGKSETEFAPQDLLTREEAATILFRLINVVHPDWEATELYYEFDDSNNISEWAMPSIQRICNMGIMNGVGSGKFAPQDSYTTEQAIVTLVRVYANFSDGKNVTNTAITNAENLSYAQIEDLQKQVDNGHFPWRLDYKQVITSFISGLGENVENGELISFAGDDAKCSGTYIVGNNSYLIELFKPIDKSENGIWIVKTFQDDIAANIERMSDKEFLLLSSDDTEYKLNSDMSTINKEPVSEKEGRGDGFHWEERSYGDIFVEALIGDDNSTNIIRITTTSNNYKTPRDIKVGDTLQKLQEKYTEDLTKALSDEICYVYEPPKVGFNRIYFYMQNDVITKIIIENGIDG